MQPNLKRLQSYHQKNSMVIPTNPITENSPLGKPLPELFFTKNSSELAQDLLGKLIVHNVNGQLLKCKIVETEIYPGGEDKASHSYNGRKTPGNAAMFMKPGTSYVYFIYGMYFCFNISSADYGGVVLIRAGEPIEGMQDMIINRIMSKQLKNKQKQIYFKDICNGPGKLCTAMQIDKENYNAIDLTNSNKLWIENSDNCSDIKDRKIILSKRFGIDKTGQEAVDKLYRFYIFGNKCVSKIDKIREQEIKKQTSN